MSLINSFYVIIFQISIIFLIALSIGFIYREKQFYILKNYLLHRLFLGGYVGVLIFLMYYLRISNILSILMIILSLTIMYFGLQTTLVIYLFIFLGNYLYYDLNFLLIFYLLIILFLKLIFSFKINLIVQYHIVLLMSLLFLNIELFIDNRKLIDYGIYNLSSIITWIIILIIVIYFQNKKKLYVEFQNKAFLDKATRVKNYYCLVNKSYKLLKDKKAEISLILVNIDRLKDINNLYGNLYGDKVVKIVADSIIEIVDGYGEVYRLDGDTFCVVAVKDKLKMMKTISDKIRLNIDLKNLIIDNNKIKITVSIGGYHGKIESNNIDDYIELAHESLVNSKYIGRNRVVINNNMVYHMDMMK